MEDTTLRRKSSQYISCGRFSTEVKASPSCEHTYKDPSRSRLVLRIPMYHESKPCLSNRPSRWHARFLLAPRCSKDYTSGFCSCAPQSNPASTAPPPGSNSSQSSSPAAQPDHIEPEPEEAVDPRRSGRQTQPINRPGMVAHDGPMMPEDRAERVARWLPPIPSSAKLVECDEDYKRLAKVSSH